MEIPVDAKYNGQTVLFLHCKDKVLENRTLTVENDIAKGTFSGLSPFAVAEVTGKTIIPGLPDAYTPVRFSPAFAKPMLERQDMNE